MVGKSQIKFIKSLQQKKYRNKHRMFVVEGIKTVNEFLNSSFEPYKIFVTSTDLIGTGDVSTELISEIELKQMSSLKNPNGVLGVFQIPKPEFNDQDDWVLVLDDVRDPGNLGTIIRLCDWFGVKNLVCSENTVDCFNPKVLQATMGSLTRVNIIYADLVGFLENSTVPIYGTFMNGENIYSSEFPKKGILVLGNEANGISTEVENLVSSRIGIPQFGDKVTESLNVATATSIFLSEIRRS